MLDGQRSSAAGEKPYTIRRPGHARSLPHRNSSGLKKSNADDARDKACCVSLMRVSARGLKRALAASQQSASLQQRCWRLASTSLASGSLCLAAHTSPHSSSWTARRCAASTTAHEDSVTDAAPAEPNTTEKHVTGTGHSPSDSAAGSSCIPDAVVVNVIGQLKKLATGRPLRDGFDPEAAAADDGHDSGPADTLASFMASDGLAEDVSAPHADSSQDAQALKEEQQPAWVSALTLGEHASQHRLVAEWQLFVCLRSQQPALSTSPAPLEVCDALYLSWRESLRRESAQQERCRQDTNSSQQPSLHSPFHPKGVHHHYATWLLRELHATLRLWQEMRLMHAAAAPQTAEAARNTEQEASEALHHACILLSRALEVLLLELPEDEAALRASQRAAHLSQKNPSSPQRGAVTAAAAPLRPTTALLVLEAARHLAQLSCRPECVEAFPIFSFLLSPSSALQHRRATTQLAEVARRSFELVLEQAAPSPVRQKLKDHGRKNRHLHHALQSDAAVLYLGFLMSAATSPALTEDVRQHVEHFVIIGSPTAQQLSAPQHGERDASFSFGEADALLPHLATAVQALLRTSYLGGDEGMRGDGDSSTSSPPPSPPAAAARHAFVKLLLHTAPQPIWSLADALNPCGEEEDVVAANAELPAPASVQSRVRPRVWSAWLLSILIARLQRRALQCDATAAESAAEWQRQSESALQVATHIIVDLRQHSSTSGNEQLATPATAAMMRDTAVAARRALQQSWRVIFLGAQRGCFCGSTASLSDTRGFAGERAWEREGKSQRQYASLFATPSFLPQLCYPYYDKTQWRAHSVNVYLRLLDQWGQGRQIRSVFAAVTRREARFQSDVRAAVAAERRAADVEDDAADRNDTGEKEEPRETPHPSTAAIHSVFRHYRPALSLASCVIVLRHCGCPSSVLAELHTEMGHASTEPSSLAAANRTSSSPLKGSAQGGEDDQSLAGAIQKHHGAAASDARLAGAVLQYMLCRLHVHERAASLRAAQHTPAVAQSALEGQESSDDDVDDSEGCGSELAGDDGVSSGVVEGYPLPHWVRWIGESCVPAVETLYVDAGLEEEWEELGF